MADLLSAVSALNKIPNVLSVRPVRGTSGCRVDILRDTPEVRAAVAKVMARHHMPYDIHLVVRSPEHIAAVEQVAHEAQTRQSGRATMDNKLPAHAHRARRGGTP